MSTTRGRPRNEVPTKLRSMRLTDDEYEAVKRFVHLRRDAQKSFTPFDVIQEYGDAGFDRSDLLGWSFVTASQSWPLMRRTANGKIVTLHQDGIRVYAKISEPHIFEVRTPSVREALDAANKYAYENRGWKE